MLKLIILIFFSTNIYAQSNKYLELSLEECIEIALENNLQLKRSIINERLQKVGYNQSILQQTPTLNVFSNYGNNYGRSIDPTTNTFISNNSNFSGVNASASLNLFSGFSVRNNIKRSKTLLEKSAFDLENTRNNVMLSVVSSYLNVLLSTDRLDNARFQLQSTQEQLSRTTKLVDAGSIAITNKLNLEAQVAGDELALIQQENNYRLTVLQLKQLLLLETNKEIKIIKPNIELTPSTVIDSDPDEIYSVAINILPEIKSAEKNAQSSLYDLRISRSGRFPTLSVSSNFSSNYSSFANREREFYDGFSMQPTTIGYLTNNPLQTVSSLTLVPNVVGSDKDFTLLEQWKDYLSKSLSFLLNSTSNFETYLFSANFSSTIEKESIKL